MRFTQGRSNNYLQRTAAPYKDRWFLSPKRSAAIYEMHPENWHSMQVLLYTDSAHNRSLVPTTF